MKNTILFLILLLSTQNIFARRANPNRTVTEQVKFSSYDSLTVSGTLYTYHKNAPVIVLCHQAKYNKNEYAEIAQTLSKSGFNCLAIDQRSGGTLNNFKNETYELAKKKKKATEYIDAEQDIKAAVNYAANKFGKDVILWGSSYSATLALKLACEMENINAVIAFSPGNYIKKYDGKISEQLSKLKKPMFVTSSLQEANEVTQFLSKLKMMDNQKQFTPKCEGRHGSKALWTDDVCHLEYWDAVNEFLDELR